MFAISCRFAKKADVGRGGKDRGGNREPDIGLHPFVGAFSALPPGDGKPSPHSNSMRATTPSEYSRSRPSFSTIYGPPSSMPYEMGRANEIPSGAVMDSGFTVSKTVPADSWRSKRPTRKFDFEGDESTEGGDYAPLAESADSGPLLLRKAGLAERILDHVQCCAVPVGLILHVSHHRERWIGIQNLLCDPTGLRRPV